LTFTSGKSHKSKGGKRGKSSKKGGNDEWHDDEYEQQDVFWDGFAKHAKKKSAKGSSDWVSKAKGAKKRLRTAVTSANGELI
jgi:hypothetical protein